MRILYLCTHNRCRSILSQAMTNHLGQGKLIAQSAGSEPAPAVHPLTLKHLHQARIATDDLYSKSVQEVALFQPDLVFTLCDSAAQSPCPVWLNAGLRLHWALADPSCHTEAHTSDAAFAQCMQIIEQRVAILLGLSNTAKHTWLATLNAQGAI